MLRDYMSGERDDFSLEFRMRHKEGHWVDILSRAHLVRDENGQPERVVGTHLDIAERRQAERALFGERAFLQHVIDGIDDPIIVTGPDCEVARMNRAVQESAGQSPLDTGSMTCYSAACHTTQPCSGKEYPCPL
ncbi:MAG: PAS domain-containing protein [Gammaproteobacteria bacterium]|nr:PAS domain-containing protein [Gammaproteobacteria bacterium]